VRPRRAPSGLTPSVRFVSDGPMTTEESRLALDPRRLLPRAFFLALLAGPLACNKKVDEPPPAAESQALAEPTPTPAPHRGSEAPKDPHAGAAATDPHGGGLPVARTRTSLSWTDPDGWQRSTEERPMRVATYRIPGPGAGDAELAVFYFGSGEAGGVEANIERWIGQFQGLDPKTVKRDKREVNGMVQHIVEVPTGTFSSGMGPGPAGPHENTGLLAAILEAPQGAHFFKMTGPRETVDGARKAFFMLLDSVER
jgi:hypothetical protein